MRPSRVATTFTARGIVAAMFRAQFRQPLGRNEVGLVEHHHVGAEQLVLVDLLERGCRGRAMGRRGVARRLFRGSSAKRPAATAPASTTAITPSTVSLARSSGHSNAFTSGFGSARPEVSSDDVIGSRAGASRARSRPARNRRRRCSRCSSVGEFDDVVRGTGLGAAALENVAVDAEVAEFVDDQREPAAAGVAEEGGGSA